MTWQTLWGSHLQACQQRWLWSKTRECPFLLLLLLFHLLLVFVILQLHLLQRSHSRDIITGSTRLERERLFTSLCKCLFLGENISAAATDCLLVFGCRWWVRFSCGLNHSRVFFYSVGLLFILLVYAHIFLNQSFKTEVTWSHEGLLYWREFQSHYTSIKSD